MKTIVVLSAIVSFAITLWNGVKFRAEEPVEVDAQDTEFENWKEKNLRLLEILRSNYKEFWFGDRLN